VGRAAQANGAAVEELVDRSLAHYRANGLLAWARAYPEVVFTGKGEARATGNALPDRCVAIKALGGRLLWLEIKTWEARDVHSLRSRLHQLEQMQEFARDGGALGTYLVAWRWDGRLEWRLYPVMNLSVKGGAVTFQREAGAHVVGGDGYPNWLPYLVGLVKRGEWDSGCNG
jgi:Holliday junction resolvase